MKSSLPNPNILSLPDEIILRIAQDFDLRTLAAFSNASLIITRAIQTSPALAAKAFYDLPQYEPYAIFNILRRHLRSRCSQPQTLQFEAEIIHHLIKQSKSSALFTADDAIYSGHEPAIRVFVECGKNLNDGMCLARAITGHTDTSIIELLVSLGLDLKNPCNADALFCSLSKSNILQFLLSSGAPIDKAVLTVQRTRKESLLSRACGMGEIKSVEILLDHGSDINFDGGRPLHCAILQNRLEVMKCLIHRGVDIKLAYDSGSGLETPLLQCCKKGSDGAFMVLANAGADHVPHSSEILRQAVPKKMVKALVWMMKQGISVIGDPSVADAVLSAAAKKQDLESFKYFYDAGARFQTAEIVEGLLERFQSDGKPEWVAMLEKVQTEGK
ncbi:hypothetical protein HDU97_005236 [Phlyctochytrium planicorne]|nr:hypothetical protein HDU97_005236 [Phlyctochytrium planicorne]